MFFLTPRFACYKGQACLWHQVERNLGAFHKGMALLNRAVPQSEFGVATCLGFFVVVTRLKVGFAAEAALLEFGSGFGRSHLVSRRSSGNPIKDSLSGIVWFLHGLVLQPREARGVTSQKVTRCPRAGMLENRLCGTQAAVGAARVVKHSGPRRGPLRPIALDLV